MRKWMKGSYLLVLVVSMFLLFSGCDAEQDSNLNNGSNEQLPDVELTISAAASLTDALHEIQKSFERKNKAIKLNYNFGASGALQQQIEQEAPVDLFLSAAPKNMNALIDKQLIEPDKQTTLLANKLVVVIPVDGKTKLGSMAELTKAEVKHVAIGIPESVPAGSYAKEALTNFKLWEAVQAKTVQGKDVRQVLQYVETGNADAGFVYKTDALTSQNVNIAFEVDPKLHALIEYPVGIVKASKLRKEAEEFYVYLQSEEALDIFVKYGFSLPK